MGAREDKPGKAAPVGWREEDADAVTGKRVGWEPVEQSPFARFHAEALQVVDRGQAPLGEGGVRAAFPPGTSAPRSRATPSTSTGTGWSGTRGGAPRSVAGHLAPVGRR